jgi:hypothetical protein
LSVLKTELRFGLASISAHPAPAGNGRSSRRQDEQQAVVNLSKFESGAILTVMRSQYDRPVSRLWQQAVQ